MKKKEKNLKVNIMKDTSEETEQIKRFILLLVSIGIIGFLMYFVTAKFIIKDEFQNKTETTETTIYYDQVKVGNVFNRPYDEYYVMAFESEDNNAVYYSALMNAYAGKEKSIKIYYLNLSVEMNKQYVKETSNSKATKPSELSFKGTTLMKISKGKIVAYYDDVAKIEEVLK